jgi:hypothetical protein
MMIKTATEFTALSTIDTVPHCFDCGQSGGLVATLIIGGKSE